MKGMGVKYVELCRPGFEKLEFNSTHKLKILKKFT
jgi:hypothetical protein